MAILGHNGSGKSTFAKQINGILTPTDGTVWVSGMNTADEDAIWEIRKKAGMVFQNPDKPDHWKCSRRGCGIWPGEYRSSDR